MDIKLHHVAIWVKDLERMRDFYIEHFAGKANELYHNQKTGFRSYFISFADGSRVELMNKSAGLASKLASEQEYFGWAHIALSLGSKEAVDALTQRLQDAGCQLVSGPRTTGDGYYESCLLDFEGNRIELVG